MPGDFRIFSGRRLVYLKFFGETNVEHCNETLRSLVASPEWRPTFRMLIDNSEVTSYRGDFEQMQWLCAQMQQAGEFDLCRTPLVYFSPSDLAFGIARMAQQVLSSQFPFDIDVFREEAAALARLGLQETEIAALFVPTA